MISVQNGNVEMCKLLIDNDALPSINTPNNVNIGYNKKSYDNLYIIISIILCYMLYINTIVMILSLF
jgi:hypothetical protein